MGQRMWAFVWMHQQRQFPVPERERTEALDFDIQQHTFSMFVLQDTFYEQASLNSGLPLLQITGTHSLLQPEEFVRIADIRSCQSGHLKREH